MSYLVGALRLCSVTQSQAPLIGPRRGSEDQQTSIVHDAAEREALMSKVTDSLKL